MRIRSERLWIRDFRKEDAEHLYDLLSDERVMRFLEAPYSLEASKELLMKAGLCSAPLIYAVENKNQEFIGYVIYHEYKGEAWEIGWVLKPEEWHKGYASELTGRLIEDAKGKTNHLILECVPENMATKRIAQKYHFVYQGQEDGCEIYQRVL